MKIKANMLRAYGALDYFFSGLFYKGEQKLTKSLVFGMTGGFMLALGAALVKNDNLGDFSEDFNDTATYSDGVLLKMPDYCGLDDYYLLSKGPNGRMQIGKESRSDLSHVLNREQQSDHVDEIDDCMETLKDWSEDDNYKFAEDFKFRSAVEHSDVALIYSVNGEKSYLYRDVLNDSEDVLTIEEWAQTHDNYKERGNNDALYKQRFDDAARHWDKFKVKRSHADYYYTEDNQIKNADQYEVYNYKGLGFLGLFNSLFYTSLALYLVAGASPISRRSDEYHKRAEQRRNKINALNQLAGRDTLSF